MEIIFIIGHLALGLYFLNSGLNHFFNVKALTGYATAKGVPFAKASVIAAGITLTIGGISLTGWIAPVIGLGLLILTLIPLSTMIHNFWTISDPMHRASEKVAFGKNVALMGSMLIILAFIIS